MSSALGSAYERLSRLELPGGEVARILFGSAFAAHYFYVEFYELVGSKLVFVPMLRARAARAGTNLHLTSVPIIRGRPRIEIGDRCTLSALVVDADPRAHAPELTIGSDCFIASRVEFRVSRSIALGNHVGIATGVAIEDFDGFASDPERRMRGEPDPETNASPVVVEDGAWLGRGARIHRGVRVGKNAIVAAGSVVVNDVPAGHIAMGVPARMLRT